MSEGNYNAENMVDYIDNLCDDLKSAVHDLNDNRDAESYKRLTHLRMEVAALSDTLMTKDKILEAMKAGESKENKL